MPWQRVPGRVLTGVDTKYSHDGDCPSSSKLTKSQILPFVLLSDEAYSLLSAISKTKIGLSEKYVLITVHLEQDVSSVHLE